MRTRKGRANESLCVPGGCWYDLCVQHRQPSTTKMTADLVRAMRKARADEGKTVDQIHDQFGKPNGITHSQTEKILYGIAWKHV